MRHGSNREASVELEVRTGEDNRGDLPFSLARFQMIHGGVIHGRMMLLPTEELYRWEIVLPLVLDNGDTPERWLGVLGEFLAGEGFEVELPDFQ